MRVVVLAQAYSDVAPACAHYAVVRFAAVRYAVAVVLRSYAPPLHPSADHPLAAPLHRADAAHLDAALPASEYGGEPPPLSL